MNVINQTEGDGWVAYHADTVEVTAALPDASIHYSIFSPPFGSLYTYSPSDRDIGNVHDDAEFADHIRFLFRDLFRVTKPGRLCSQHCMLLPTSKARDGFIGLRDFRGDLIRLMQDVGWTFHSEVVIWKDPVTAMQRTKALGLLHKQIRKDSCMSRQGIPDYLVTFRKPGENDEPVSHEPAKPGSSASELLSAALTEYPVALWQRVASPVWAVAGRESDDGFHDVSQDINPSDTLQYRSAREHEDERHICPLQLPVIRRALGLWTNTGDTVLDPFGGIGSTGVVAREMGRRFVGTELKRSYYDQMVRNLQAAGRQTEMFE